MEKELKNNEKDALNLLEYIAHQNLTILGVLELKYGSQGNKYIDELFRQQKEYHNKFIRQNGNKI